MKLSLKKQRESVDKEILDKYYDGNLDYRFGVQADAFELGIIVGADETIVLLTAMIQEIINNHKGE